MPFEFVIREFKAADTSQVIELWEAALGYTSPHNRPELAIRNKLAYQSELFFVAATEAGVIGTIMGGYDGHRGWIYSLAVAEDVRLRGVGAALVRRVETALRERGCPKLNLQIFAGNEQVVAFYERLGYKVEPRTSMGKLLLSD